jgi:hypothetical protein
MTSGQQWALTSVERRLDTWARRRLESLAGRGRVRGEVVGVNAKTVTVHDEDGGSHG